ncbi:hypothetical protein D3C73_1496420 [compost metagenome]
MSLRVIISFVATSFLLLPAALFLAQHQSVLLRIALLQVDRAFTGAFLHRHHRRNIRTLTDRVGL